MVSHWSGWSARWDTMGVCGVQPGWSGGHPHHYMGINSRTPSAELSKPWRSSCGHIYGGREC